MKVTSTFTLFVILAIFITGCSSQQSPDQSLVGSYAPDFTLDDALGGQTSLSDFEGTPVLLFFHMAVG
jgi:cytochrome oxidase Cu insertion factor (SCO1/SenC/PrrC family)